MSTPPPQQPPPDFPPIDPTTFDLIILGTSLPNSILSAAATTAGKSVLHLDSNPFYGSLFSSLSPPNLTSLLSLPPFPSDVDDDVIRKFAVDVAGPKVLMCGGKAVEVLVKSGCAGYVNFKSVEGSLMYEGEIGRFWKVPDSRRALFRDKRLKLVEKTELNRFFNFVKGCFSDGGGGVSEEELESPFVEFLNKRLSPNLIRIILYAIAFADYDQENLNVCKDLLKTKDGIQRLALYHSSMDRFPDAPGAMLYPMYGQGELPQAFCRRAAVKGCIHVLRMPVASLLADEDTGHYKGVKLASGQDIFSQQLLIDPHYKVPSPGLDGSSRYCQDSIPKETKKVARGICITRKSLDSEATNLLIVYPPRSLYPEQATSVRGLQLGSNLAVCPDGMFILYLSTLCDDADQGKELLNAAINALFEQPVSGSSHNPEDEVTEEKKPALVWTAVYIQEIIEESVNTISRSTSPDGNLDYNNLIDITEKMFQQMFPGEEYFPEIASTEDPENTEEF